MRTRIFAAIAALASLAFAGGAAACDEAVALEKAQIRELLNLIKDPQGDALEQIFALETLMCSKRPAVRDLATRTALVSPNATLKSSAMFELFFSKEALLVEFLPEEGRPKQYYDFIKRQPAISFTLGAKSREGGCIVLPHPSGTRDCTEANSWNVVQVSGERVQLLFRNEWNGDFELEGTDLVGTMSGSNLRVDDAELGAVPARIRLID